MRRNLDAERIAKLHGANVAAPKRRQQVFGAPRFEAFGEFGNVDLAEAQPPVFTFQDGPALRYMCLMILLL